MYSWRNKKYTEKKNRISSKSVKSHKENNVLYIIYGQSARRGGAMWRGGGGGVCVWGGGGVRGEVLHVDAKVGFHGKH